VLFCDLVGSTELSERPGPEEYAYILKEYRALAIGAIEPFEAHVPEYLVDGIPVFFGFPIVHEDDTHRAILAAGAIQDAIKRGNARLDVVQRPCRARGRGPRRVDTRPSPLAALVARYPAAATTPDLRAARALSHRLNLSA
jgi:class 3 adenylate cyclase